MKKGGRGRERGRGERGWLRKNSLPSILSKADLRVTFSSLESVWNIADFGYSAPTWQIHFSGEDGMKQDVLA